MRVALRCLSARAAAGGVGAGKRAPYPRPRPPEPRGDSDGSLSSSSSSSSLEHIYGVAPVQAALVAGRRRLHELHISGVDMLQRRDIERIYNLARTKGLPVHFSGKRSLERLVPAGAPHQHLALCCSPLPVTRDDDQLAADVSRAARQRIWLVLDSIHDPMNLGAIARSAVFFGAERLVLAGHGCPLTPTVSKASSGAIEGLPVWHAASVGALARQATASGWCVAGTVAPRAGDHPKLFTHAQIPQLHTRFSNFMLVMGNEHEGLRQGDLDSMNVWLTVQDRMHAEARALGVESLNVGAACATLLAFITSQFNR